MVVKFATVDGAAYRSQFTSSASQNRSFDETYGQTMEGTAATTASPGAADEDSGTLDLDNFSISINADSCNDTAFRTELSSFSAGSFSSEGTVGSLSADNFTLDSIGHMLIKLDDNDSSMTELRIDCKMMDKEAATEVGLYLPGNTHVKRLKLNCGSLPYHREVLRDVASGLKGNASIEHIQIHDARMNHEMASWFLPFFTHSRSLQRIIMVNCKGSGLEELFVAMQHNKNIEHLTFRSCRWAKYISDIMASSLPLMNLVTLSLIDVNMPEDCWPYLFRKIGECRELTRLDLSRNRLSESCIHLLTKGLTAQRLCSTLVLSSCRLRNGCLRQLAKGLRDTALKSVDLSQNPKISDRGVVIYVKGLLLRNNAITHVRLDGCGLSEETLETIEGGLRYNQSILHNVCSFAVFDIFDSIVAPHGKKRIRSTAESTSVQTESVPSAEERDESETAKETLNESEICRMVDDEARLFGQNRESQ